MLVPNPKKALKSPGVQSFGLKSVIFTPGLKRSISIPAR
jgi:hypothetical protein